MKRIFGDWTDTKLEVKGDKAEFSVWGRKYTFEKSFVPTSIISLDKELLEAPITLDADFSGKTGEWHSFDYFVYSTDAEKAVIIISARCENTIGNATVTVEFDGFVKVEFRISSYWQYDKRNKPELTGLYLNIPMNKAHSSLFHYWPNNKSSIVPAQDKMNSGATKDIKLPFKPYVWYGDEEVGLGVFVGESEQYFQYDENCIEVSGNNLKITFLDSMPKNWQGRSDKWADTLIPIEFTFGFHATPVKPFKFDKGCYRRFHMYNVRKNDFLNMGLPKIAADAGAEWLVLHEDWTIIQNFGLAEDEEKFKAFADECHKYGLKLMLYFGYEYSTLMADFNKNGKNYINYSDTGNYNGGWQRSPAQRAFMVCYNSDYKKEWMERIKYVMDVYGADGIYTDGTYIPWECANERHGCGYRDEEGKLHSTYPVLELREHVKNLYQTVHERKGIVDAHQSTCCTMPTLSFCDSYWDGENIQSQLSDSNMNFLNLEAFRAEYMGYNLGIPANFIAYTTDADLEENKVMEGEVKARTMAGIYSIALLHNIHPRPNTIKNLKYASYIWKLFDDLELDGAKWIPYWNNNISSIEEESAHTCAYETKNGIVLYAVDFIGNREITVNAEGNKLVQYGTGKEYEIIDGKAKVTLETARATFFSVK
ncbi:MAG: hypothetical protein J6V58_05835 [Clostridia bacterium]|nr:hypothetical protein [Clostridia bacterium]